MAIPDFYQNSVEAIEAFLPTLKKGEVKEIARSVGGRAVYTVSYGEFEPVERTANLSSALAGRKPAAFYGPGRTKQVMMVVSAILRACPVKRPGRRTRRPRR